MTVETVGMQKGIEEGEIDCLRRLNVKFGCDLAHKRARFLIR